MNQTDHTPKPGNRPVPQAFWPWGCLLLVVLSLIGWAYYQLIDTELIGFTHDDGVYVVTAKALAQGHGYHLMHLVGEPAQTKYPFLFPALLAPVWWIAPQFPANLVALNCVPWGLGLLALGVLYGYARHIHRFSGPLALLTVILSASSFFFMYFFSTIMSEALYLLLTLTTLWFAQHALGDQSPPPTRPLRSVGTLCLLIGLSALCFYTRVLGIALIAAIVLWFLLNRQWRAAAFYSIGCLFSAILPWMLWVKQAAPAVTELTAPTLTPYVHYGQEFLINLHGHSWPQYFSTLGNDLVVLITKLLENMVPLVPNFFKIYPQYDDHLGAGIISLMALLVSIYGLSGYLLLQGVHCIRQSLRQGFSPQVYSISALYLAFYLLLITLWRYEDQLARFITVITPLAWIYFFKPIQNHLHTLAARDTLTRRARFQQAALVTLVIGISLLAVWPAPHSYRLIQASRQEHWVDSGSNRWLWEEYKATFQWIKAHTKPQEPLGAFSDVVFYLYTERPTFYVFLSSLQKSGGRYQLDSLPRLMRSLDHHGVRYLVVEPHMEARQVLAPENWVAHELIKRYPERFERIYASPKSQVITIYRILPRRVQRV